MGAPGQRCASPTSASICSRGFLIRIRARGFGGLCNVIASWQRWACPPFGGKVGRFRRNRYAGKHLLPAKLPANSPPFGGKVDQSAIALQSRFGGGAHETKSVDASTLGLQDTIPRGLGSRHHDRCVSRRRASHFRRQGIRGRCARTRRRCGGRRRTDPDRTVPHTPHS